MLAELTLAGADQAFDRFYGRWKDDHLVIDSWFAYQAASPLASSLATVKKLTRHPLFSIKNPNKVRALIGTFAMGNPVNFNRPDGRGYDFVADRVLEIDDFNPQIAARMLSAFRSWKALGAPAPASCKENPPAHRQDQTASRTMCSRSCRRCSSRNSDTAAIFLPQDRFASRQPIGLSVKLTK